MNFKTTVALLVLLLLVGAYFVFVEQGTQTTHERLRVRQEHGGNVAGEPVFTADQLSTEQIDSITIQRSGGVVELNKEGADWWQTYPVRFPLDTWSVRRVIDDMAGLRFTERHASGSGEFPTADQAGLSPAKSSVTLRVGVDEPIEHTVHLGKSPGGGWGYARVNGEGGVYIVNDALHRLVDSESVRDWRKKSVEIPGKGTVDRVTLNRDGRVVTLHHHNGDWVLGGTTPGRADAAVVQKLLGDVGRVSISRFVDDNPSDLSLYGLDAPGSAVTIEAVLPDALPPNATAADPGSEGDQAPQSDAPVFDSEDPPGPEARERVTLHIGAPGDLNQSEYFAALTRGDDGIDVVFVVSQAETTPLDTPVDDLRDPRIAAVSLADVREARVARAGSTAVQLSRSVAGWSFASPGPGFSADTVEVSEWIERVTQIKAVGYDSSVPADTQPLGVVSLSAVGRAEPDVLRVYPTESGDTLRVVRNEESIGYLVPSSAMADLLITPLALRDRSIIDLSSETLERVDVRNSYGQRYEFSRDVSAEAETDADAANSTPAPWRLEGHESFEANALHRLLAALQPLRVKRWLASPLDAPGASSAVPGGDAAIRAGFQAREGRRWGLTIDPQTRIARLDDETQAFELTPESVAVFDAEFRDRTVLASPIGTIRSVAVTRGGESVTIVRATSGRYSEASDQALDEAVAAGVFDTLAGLRAERFIDAPQNDGPDRDLGISLLITMTDETRQELFLFGEITRPDAARGAEPVVARLGDRWFYISAALGQKLGAPLAQSGASAERSADAISATESEPVK